MTEETQLQTLQTLLDSASTYALQKLELFDDDARATIAAALQRGCMIEIRICPMAASRVRLMLVGAQDTELELGRLQEQHTH